MSARNLSCRDAHRNGVRVRLAIALEQLRIHDTAAYAVLLAQAWAFLVDNSVCSDFPSKPS